MCRIIPTHTRAHAHAHAYLVFRVAVGARAVEAVVVQVHDDGEIVRDDRVREADADALRQRWKREKR